MPGRTSSGVLTSGSSAALAGSASRCRVSGSSTAVIPMRTGPAAVFSAGPDDRLETLGRPHVGADDLGLLAQGVHVLHQRLVGADLEVFGRERQGVVLHQGERLERDVKLELRLLEASPGPGGVLDQAAQVEQRERPFLLVAEPLDQVVAAFQAAELALGAAARLEVAELLARDDQRPGRGRPVGEQLCASGRRRRDDGAGRGRLVRRGFRRRAADIGQQARDQGQGDERPVRGSGDHRGFRINLSAGEIAARASCPRRRSTRARRVGIIEFPCPAIRPNGTSAPTRGNLVVRSA